MAEVKRHTGGRTKGDGKGKTGGRKKGSKNKVSAEMRDIMKELYENNMDKAQKMLDLLVDPKDWIYAYIKLAEFCVPKKAAVNITAEKKPTDFKSELEQWTQEEV